MTALIGRTGFEGARLFSRLMIWVCLTLSVTIAAAVIALVAFVVVFDTSNLIPCKSGDITRSWVHATYACSTTTTQTVTTHINGRPPTTRSTTVTTPGMNTRGFSAGDLAMPLLMTPPLLVALALWQAAGFFRQLFKNQALSAVTARRLRNFSILGVLFLVLNPTMLGIVRALFQPFHVEPAALNWGPTDVLGWKATTSDLITIVFAATLIAMVSVLARAAKLAEDHAQIV